jgi:hypothetical protein
LTALALLNLLIHKQNLGFSFSESVGLLNLDNFEMKVKHDLIGEGHHKHKKLSGWQAESELWGAAVGAGLGDWPG